MIKNLFVSTILAVFSLKRTEAMLGGSKIFDFTSYSYMGFVDVYDPTTLKHRNSCGGTVVDEQFILTSAHCFFNAGHPSSAKFSIISLGSAKSKFEYPKERIEVQGYPVTHPAYERRGWKNDIALIRLDFPIDFKMFPQVTKIELAKLSDVPESNSCFILGWGATDLVNITADLNKAQFPLLPTEACKAESKHFDENLYFCGGSLDTDQTPGSPDPCKGDSGGPLVCKVQGAAANAKLKQFGIISYKKGKCDATKYRPAFFTRIPYYEKWAGLAMNDSRNDPPKTT